MYHKCMFGQGTADIACVSRMLITAMTGTTTDPVFNEFVIAAVQFDNCHPFRVRLSNAGLEVGMEWIMARL